MIFVYFTILWYNKYNYSTKEFGIVVTLIIGIILYCLGEIIQKLQNIEYLHQSTDFKKHEEIKDFDQFIKSLTDEEKSKILQTYKK